VAQILLDLRSKGPSTGSERAKRTSIAGRLRTVERIGGFGGKADLLNNYQVFLGDPGYLPGTSPGTAAVTPASVAGLATRILVPLERVELDVVPAPQETAARKGERR